MNLFEQIDAAAKLAVDPTAYRLCTHRGAAVGQRECRTCRMKVMYTVYECALRPEGVTYPDCKRCRQVKFPEKNGDGQPGPSSTTEK